MPNERSIIQARKRFLQLLKARKKQRARITGEVFDSLVERQERVPQNKGRSSREVLKIVDSFGIDSEQERKYVLKGLRKAKIMFGEKLKDPAYLRDIVEHLRAEFDLLVTEKSPKIALRLGLSPFLILEIDKEIENLPHEYSSLAGTIRVLVLGKNYPNVKSVVATLRDIDSVIKELPPKYSNLSGTIRVLVLKKRYPNVKSVVATLEDIDSAIKELPQKYSYLSGTIRGLILVKKYRSVGQVVGVLRKLDSDISIYLPKEYSYLSRLILGLVLSKKYPGVQSLIKPIKKITSFLSGLNLYKGSEIKLIQYTFSLKTKTNTYEEAFDNAIKYFTLPLRILSLDAKSMRGLGRSYHEIIPSDKKNPLELLQERENQMLLDKLSSYFGERYQELLDYLEEHDTLPDWAIDKIEIFKKKFIKRKV